jgi:uncharacterized protein YbjT (DUF2867 family)
LLGGNFFLALIAVFIFFGASGESQLVRQRELTRGLSVSEVMGTKPRTETVTPYHTFGQVLDLVIHGYQEDFPVVDEMSKALGRPVTVLNLVAWPRSLDLGLLGRVLAGGEAVALEAGVSRADAGASCLKPPVFDASMLDA